LTIASATASVLDLATVFPGSPEQPTMAKVIVPAAAMRWFSPGSMTLKSSAA
jgi:hypothetical protein